MSPITIISNPLLQKDLALHRCLKPSPRTGGGGACTLSRIEDNQKAVGLGNLPSRAQQQGVRTVVDRFILGAELA